MEQEKGLMLSFAIANIADVATTSVGLGLEGFREIGPVGHTLVENGVLNEAFLVRTGVTVAMIGMYALTKKRNSRWAFSFEKAIQISNMIAWGVAVLNAAQIGHYMFEVLKK